MTNAAAPTPVTADHQPRKRRGIVLYVVLLVLLFILGGCGTYLLERPTETAPETPATTPVAEEVEVVEEIKPPPVGKEVPYAFPDTWTAQIFPGSRSSSTVSVIYNDALPRVIKGKTVVGTVTEENRTIPIAGKWDLTLTTTPGESISNLHWAAANNAGQSIYAYPPTAKGVQYFGAIGFSPTGVNGVEIVEYQACPVGKPKSACVGSEMVIDFVPYSGTYG